MHAVRHNIPVLLLTLAVGCTPATGPVGVSPTPTLAPTAMPSANPSATPTVAANFKLSGTVRDDGRSVVAGATITVKPVTGADLTAQTGADGSYALQVPAGSYLVSASKAGWTRRTQSVTVAQDTQLDFGAMTDKGDDPYFLSNNPEIEQVDVKEDAPGGPLKMTFTLSEPITKDAQASFSSHFELNAGLETPFLRYVGGGAYNLKMDTAWDDTGRVFTLNYKYPYLASGDKDVTYTARLRQNQLDTKDPETREYEWEDLGIVDAEGKALGKNRAQYAFKNQKPTFLAPELMTQLKYGYYTDQRRWNLTHEGVFRFTAAKDTKKPSLLSVSVRKNEVIGNINEDILTLNFDKPMRCAKDRDHAEFTWLDLDKQLLVVNVSKFKSGSSPTALPAGSKPKSFEFSETDPNVVYLHYPANLFDTYEWFEVTLEGDFRDPVGNKVDGAHSKATGTVS